MIIKYCGNCPGKPYTKDMNKLNCPSCGTPLQAEFVDDSSLADRAVLPDKETDIPMQQNPFGGNQPEDIPVNPFDEKGFAKGKQNYDPFNSTPDGRSNNESQPTVRPTATIDTPLTDLPLKECDEQESSKETSKTITIRGKVAQYSSSGKEDGEYRRLLPVRIYQAIVYRQRLEDVLHRFTVRVERDKDALGYQEYTDIPVNVHGTIAGGLQIVDNNEVEVHGRFRNGVLMADSIHVINNGHRSKVGFQRSVSAITYGILSAIMLAFVCFVAATSNGSFLANLKEFCTVWLVFAVILTVLYLIISLTQIGLLTRMFSRKKRTFPIFGILLISLAFAFLFISVFGSFAGFGTFLSGWIYSIIPLVIIIVALFFIIKSMF